MQALCRTQKDILDAVAPMVKVGGTLVYSTCSILPQENEEQIRAFLERHPEYEIQPMGAELPESWRRMKTPSVCRCSRTGTARTASTSAACAG